MSIDKEILHEKIIEKIKGIFDPELPVNIYDLGLIYKVDINDRGYVQITMTLTAPSCPAAQSLPVEVDQKIREIEGVSDVNVMITWTPKW
jgi:FeS assembly SUF system protein